MSAPFCVGTEVSTLAAGQTIQPNVDQLCSPFRDPVWIDEIAFATKYVTNNTSSPLGAIRCKLNMGRIQLTGSRADGGFIPLYNFGPLIQALNVETETTTNWPTTPRPTISYARWRLPRPLLVPPGSMVQPVLSRDADSQSGNAWVAISYLGRYCEPGFRMPKEIAVPWVSLWAPSLASTASAQSSELDLVNPFDRPLHVQRLIGRVRVTIAGAITNGPQAQVVAGTLVIKDSLGNNVVRDFSGFTDIFDGPRSAWTVGSVLAPRERYNLTIQDFSGYTSPQLTVSMVGWRKERVA